MQTQTFTSDDIKKAVMRHLIERREFLNIEKISAVCGFSKSMLHKAIFRFKESEKSRPTANLLPLFIVACFLGLVLDGVKITLHYEWVEVPIKKGNRRGEFDKISRPTSVTLQQANGKRAYCTTTAELLNFFSPPAE